MARTKNIFIDQGSNFSLSLTAYNSSNVPITLTGCTVSGQLRRSYDSATGITLNCQVTGGTGGYIIGLGATASAALKYGRYVYDVEAQYSNGQVQRLVQGIAYVDPEATK